MNNLKYFRNLVKFKFILIASISIFISCEKEEIQVCDYNSLNYINNTNKSISIAYIGKSYPQFRYCYTIDSGDACQVGMGEPFEIVILSEVNSEDEKGRKYKKFANECEEELKLKL